MLSGYAHLEHALDLQRLAERLSHVKSVNITGNFSQGNFILNPRSEAEDFELNKETREEYLRKYFEAASHMDVMIKCLGNEKWSNIWFFCCLSSAAVLCSKITDVYFKAAMIVSPPSPKNFPEWGHSNHDLN
ncbi:hypothetical protein WN943_024089 [Citrus x changshan-huyou]